MMRWASYSRPGALVLALLGWAACAEPDPRASVVSAGEIRVAVETVRPGEAVPLEAEGLPPNAPVEIGLGQPRSDRGVVARARTDAGGRLSATVTVPEWASAGRPHVLSVGERGHPPRAVSEPFVVGEPGDPVRVTGTLTDEGVECPAIRDADGTLYTLVLPWLEHGPGTEVRVEGTIADGTICRQGTTVAAERVERR